MQYVLTQEEHDQLIPLKEYHRVLADYYVAYGQMEARGQVCLAHEDSKSLWEKIYQAEAENEYVKMGREMKDTGSAKWKPQRRIEL